MANTGKIRLNMLGLPVIETIEDFSKLTHISSLTIFKLSQFSDKFYRTYEIPKKNGKTRQISQPSKKLKGLQAWILNNILNKLKVSSSSKGFTKGASIIDNAKPHMGANAIMTIDIENFFGKITRNKVFNIFSSIGYNNKISTIFTNLCVYKDSLPQGGPCSPQLSNLASWGLDVRLQGYVGSRTITYTRYADDLTFSGQNHVKLVRSFSFIKKIINNESFEINDSKTRIAGASRAKIVTGLVLAEDSVGIGRKKYKLLRSKLHHLAIDKTTNSRHSIYHINGWLAYLKNVDIVRFKKTCSYIVKLQSKFPAALINQISIPSQREVNKKTNLTDLAIILEGE